MFQSIRFFIQVTVARAYVRVIGAQRELSWIVGDTLLPFLSVMAFVYVYRAMQAPLEYTGFVVLGGIVVAFWMHMLWSMGMQFFWEKEVGNLALYLMTPMPRAALLLGMALGGIFMTSTRAAIIYIASRLFFHVEFHVSQPWLALGVCAATLLALYGMGMAVSSLFFLAGRGINNAMGVMAEPVFFLGGFYFPVRQLGVYVATAAAGVIPVALGLDALRQTMFSSHAMGLYPPEKEVIALLIMGVIFLILSIWLIDYLEKVGRSQGRLILKNQ